MRPGLILAFVFVGSCQCMAAVDAVKVFEPRQFGYFIGDTFERRVEVITSGDTELLTAGLPRPGPLTYWLDLVAIHDTVRESDGRKIHDITLKYQTFYSALQPTRVKIPAYPLKFRNPGQSEVPGDIASIPALPMVMSPLREFATSDFMSGKSVEIADILRPDAKAQLIGTSRLAKLLTLALAAFALSIVLLFWHYAKGPFARRQGRPFTIAERRIRRLQATETGPKLYEDSLVILHRAFDESYGRRVFAGDLTAFLGRHQRFAKFAEKLQRFFESSRLLFFSGDKSTAEARFPIEDVKQLAAELAREEKAAA